MNDLYKQPGPDELVNGRALLDWFRTHVRPFMADQAPDAVRALEDDCDRLAKAIASPDTTTVCVLGNSGVGKSTLLNALTTDGQTIVPAGGLGPLTALATEITFSESPAMSVEYHPRKQLWKVAFALNAKVRRDRASGGDQVQLPPGELDDSEAAEIIEDFESASGSRDTINRTDELVRQAKVLVAGNQNADRTVEYLADALSVACGYKAQWSTELIDEDAPRLSRIRQALDLANRKELFRRVQGDDRAGFRDCLRDHAAGFLAPLIARIEVGWPSSVLKNGLVLVDLPGVGVAQDVYRKVTQRFIRDRARAVIIAVDKSGATEAVMDLLRTSGFWDRLVLASDDPDSDPCSLFVAVTMIDNLANEEWAQLEPDVDGKKPSKAAVYSELRSRTRTSMRKQFEWQVQSFVPSDSNEIVRVARERAKASLIDSLEVFPVSAPEYRRLIVNDDDDRPFLKDQESTGIPSFRSTLTALAKRQRDGRIQTIERITSRLAQAILDQVVLIEARWKEDAREAAEAKRIRGALEEFLSSRREEYIGRRASFRNFLQKTVPTKISNGVLEASDEARKFVKKYLNGLQDAHWATLRAAVRRGGTFYGSRAIDLPSDIAVRYQDPLAAVWSQTLLKDIRQETYTLAKDMRSLVEEICEWAHANADAYSDPKVLDTQKKVVSGQAEQLREVGKEAIEDLRAAVRDQVAEAVERPIRNACKRFVEEGGDSGPGTKRRILELFERLAEHATESARKPAEKALTEQYGGVRQDVQKAFQDWGDPLEQTADAIVARHEERLRRSDSQKRARVHKQIADLRASVPNFVSITMANR